jgi:archaellum component FlaC
MEILITILGLGFLALAGMIVRLSAEESKQKQGLEEAKKKRLDDFESEAGRKDSELKRIMEEHKRIEEEFFKVKDEVDIYKKDNSELMQKVKHLEKAREEIEVLKADLKQREGLIQQETLNRQKAQGELSVKDCECEKLRKDLAELKEVLRFKTQMYEGLKGQFEELETEVQKVREEALEKQEVSKEEPQDGGPGIAGVQPEEPQQKEPESEEIKPEAPGPQEPPSEESGPERPRSVELNEVTESREAKSEVPKPEEPRQQALEEKGGSEDIPGFSSATDIKMDIKKEMPSDTDFLKAQPPQVNDGASGPVVPEGTFKFTNVNRPAHSSPLQEDKKKSVEEPSREEEKTFDESHEKAKHKPKAKKKETLIDGFRPPHKDTDPN